MGKTVIYAATKSAKERLAKGEYKRRCARGCACGIAPPKKEKEAPKEAPAKE